VGFDTMDSEIDEDMEVKHHVETIKLAASDAMCRELVVPILIDDIFMRSVSSSHRRIEHQNSAQFVSTFCFHGTQGGGH
jgi:hypothetical protein